MFRPQPRTSVWLFALCVLAGIGGAVQAQEGKRYAVLVAGAEYDHSKLPPLKFTENDVTELAKLLRESGYEVVLLTDTAGAKDKGLLPTGANIRKQLKAMLDKTKRDDLVVVAFAGHGLQFEDDKDAYFCPRDARPFKEDKETLISLGDVYKDLDKAGAGVKVLLVDACRSDPTPGRGRGVDRPPLHEPGEGVYAFYSCNKGERAFEHADLKHGVFFYNVLEGLRGKANRGDDVNIEEMAIYVRKAVPDQVGKLFEGMKQNPTVEMSRASGKPVVLLPRRAEEMELEKDIAVLEAQVKGKGSMAFGEFAKKKGPTRATAWKTAAERGSLRGMYLWALANEYGGGVPLNGDEAFNWYRKAAKQGFAPAECELAYYYKEGILAPKDVEEAVKWYRKAAEQGYFMGQFQLAYAYNAGVGIDKDQKEAVQWYRKSAEQGFVMAQNNLGVAYEYGNGVDKNEKEAVQWYQKAAEQGFSQSQYSLALCYDNGTGIAKDEQEAVKWYRKAADQGHMEAQFNLAVAYAQGAGIEKDLKEAARWYRKAAEQNYPAALNNLGNCYKSGQGVDQDLKEAAKWFRKAAEQGNARGQFNLGVCYEHGEGVAKDREEAIKWYRKAAKQGHENAALGLKRLGAEP